MDMSCFVHTYNTVNKKRVNVERLPGPLVVTLIDGAEDEEGTNEEEEPDSKN